MNKVNRLKAFLKPPLSVEGEKQVLGLSGEKSQREEVGSTQISNTTKSPASGEALLHLQKQLLWPMWAG